MLRKSCKAFCCVASRPALGRSLAFATTPPPPAPAAHHPSSFGQASSSSSSSSSSFPNTASYTPASTSSRRAGEPSSTRATPVHVDFDVPKPLPRASDMRHEALRTMREENLDRPTVPPKVPRRSKLAPGVLPPEGASVEALEDAPLLPASATPVHLEELQALSKMDEVEVGLEEEQQAVLQQVLDGRSCFFTGAAGTGKSVLLRAIVRALQARGDIVAVTATTGIAARNLGTDARTVHMWSACGAGMDPFGSALDMLDAHRAATVKQRIAPKQRQLLQAFNRWRDTQVLIIDEISMLDGRLLDALDTIGRIVRSLGNDANRYTPFGGLQVVFAGDFYQLPPVPDEAEESMFAFESRSWRSIIHPSGPNQNCFFLRKVHRQGDPRFRALLNRLRVGKMNKADLELLRACKRKVNYVDGLDAVKLYARRHQAVDSNEEYLRSISGDLREYPANDVVGDEFLVDIKKGLATWVDVDVAKAYIDKKSQLQSTLKLKVGANVMMLKNKVDDGDYIVNGMQGIVTAMTDDEVTVKFLDGFQKTLGRVEETVLAQGNSRRSIKRAQFPLKLSHAITIHKSQGQTLERVVVNTRHCWEPGQVYVALSRATSLEGLEIEYLNPKNPALKANERVIDFMRNFAVEDSLTPETTKDAVQSTASDAAASANADPPSPPVLEPWQAEALHAAG